MWRHGPSEFKNRAFLDSHTFITFDKKSKSFLGNGNCLPTIKTNPGADVETGQSADKLLAAQLNSVQLKPKPVSPKVSNSRQDKQVSAVNSCSLQGDSNYGSNMNSSSILASDKGTRSQRKSLKTP